jgi:hypothetical protein
MDCKLDKGHLVITLPANVDNPPESSTGKTLLVASASMPTTINVKGRALRVSVNATIAANGNGKKNGKKAEE